MSHHSHTYYHHQIEPSQANIHRPIPHHIPPNPIVPTITCSHQHLLASKANNFLTPQFPFSTTIKKFGKTDRKRQRKKTKRTNTLKTNKQIESPNRTGRTARFSCPNRLIPFLNRIFDERRIHAFLCLKTKFLSPDQQISQVFY